ncbi:(2Fe-2S)-binding protein [Derxia gummosa]|uniref:(2Fe-2S)-binding protein n=1 Tax=Derxia gummosa DSM 723 TaxID=1121388 RepID=A0A8B6X884_9BURK|nr:2Fe-2S iron-sulfur cluster-binding protein [Derxia gummosa]
MIDIDFHLDGAAVRLSCEPSERLLDLLRERLGHTGTKRGCDIGRCGACLVWLDDEPVNACLVMAWQLAGRRVRTIESVAADACSEPVRAALADCGGLQCGYCTPGFVMMLTWLHGRTPRPDAATAVAACGGNLCRCTGYGGIRRAVDRLFGPV